MYENLLFVYYYYTSRVVLVSFLQAILSSSLRQNTSFNLWQIHNSQLHRNDFSFRFQEGNASKQVKI